MKKKTGFLLLKVGISIFCLILVFSQLSFFDILAGIQQIKIGYVLLAFFFFLASQVFSVFRFQVFLKAIDVQISWYRNAKLYLLGMFLNFFVPGGIGGDAYKIYWMKQRFGNSIKQLGMSVFLDRVLGLTAIFFLFGVISPFVFHKISGPILVAGIIIWFLFLFLIFWGLVHFFSKFRSKFFICFLWSIVVQSLQVICVFFLLKSLSINQEILFYFFMFLISSISSVISFSGFGSREAVFYYLAQFAQIELIESTSIGFLFNLITLFVSLFGVIYFIKRLN